jgi:hypothetical protein
MSGAHESDQRLFSPSGNGLTPRDRDRILPVMGNLLGNAVKFYQPGDTVIVRAQLRVNDALVAVSDTTRVPREEWPNMFEAYRTIPGGPEKGRALAWACTSARASLTGTEADLGRERSWLWIDFLFHIAADLTEHIMAARATHP